MKRIFKIFGILILLLVAALIAIPFIFQDNIKSIVQQTINNQVNANVAFGKVDLSLLRSFPKASVLLEDLSVINKAPFEGDTLVYTKRIAFDMSITELFKNSSEQISVNQIIIDQAYVGIKVDSLGRANYDIAKEQATSPEENTESSGFGFRLAHYEINDSKIRYQDIGSNINLTIHDLNHFGNGTFSGENMSLDTQTKIQISLDMDNTNYLNNNSIDLKATLLLDLANSKYTFKENEAHINGLPLSFDGFVQLNEKDTEVDLSFENPGSDFKEFLALVPKTYTQSLDGVSTSGNFKIKGKVQGKIDDTYIPKIAITIASNNASFQFPDLPKKVDHITIAADIKNETGLLKDTFVTLGNLTFRIDRDTFAANGVFRNVTENMLVNLAAKGTLNLANLENAYPLELEEGQQLNGILNVDLTTNFDMESLDKERYQNIKSAGNASITDFRYASGDIPNAVNIANATVAFNPETIQLDTMTATTGKSDMTASGKIDNLMGFLFSNQDLKGVFDVSSKTFAVSDFMLPEDDSSEESPDAISEEAISIPSFLDATLNFRADQVLYDNLVMKNTTGTVIIKDETALLQNVTTQMFEGNIAFNGKVSTKDKTPNFAMDIDMSKINIVQSFASLDMLQSIAPIAKSLQGLLNTKLNLSGNLKKDMTPDLISLKGAAETEVLNAQVDPKQTPLLSNLNQKMNFLDLDKLNLKDIKTQLSFDNGKVAVKPFNFEAKGIKANVSGTHSLDMNMDYQVVLDVPAKYLGSQVGSLMSNLSEQEISKMNIPLPINLKGTFSNPSVNMNTKTAIGDLTQRIVAKQKEKAKDKVKNEVKTKINEQIKGKGGKILNGLLGGDKKNTETETTTKATETPKKTEDVVKDVAKDALNNLFGKKKK